VCDHSPLTPDLCKPSKAVRTTAKAYLKTAERKLADERLKAEVAATSTLASAPSEEPATPLQEAKKEEPKSSSIPVAGLETNLIEVEQDIADKPEPSIEVGQGLSLRISHS
jgi:Tfp pilus assembly protein FimV